MTRHIVLGAGVAGRHHIRVLSERRLGVGIVLDASHDGFAQKWKQALATEPGDTLWHICTPTETHLPYLREVLTARPSAALIVEKPIGRPGDANAFSRLADGAAVMVQNQYSYAHVVAALAKAAGGAASSGPLRIEISFAKRRDNPGRFEDQERKALGYEGFHQLAIALRLIEMLRGPDSASAFASSAPLLTASNGASGYRLHFATSGLEAVLESRLDSASRSANIKIIARGGEPTSLSFETVDWFTGSPRQTHVIHARGQEFILEEDLMDTGIAACVAAISTRDTREILSNQRRALAIEGMLDRACAAAGQGSASTGS